MSLQIYLRQKHHFQSKQKVRKAILQLKNWKAPGLDGIPPEAMKADTETSVDCLYRLFVKTLVEEEILEGHHVTVNTKKSVQQDSSGKNDNRG